MKKVKCIVAAALIGAMLLPLTGCFKKIEYVKMRDFRNAVEEVFDDDEYVEEDDFLTVTDDDYAIGIFIQDDAPDNFDDIYDAYDDMMDDHDFDGRTVYVVMKNYGYILLAGDCDSDEFMRGDYFEGRDYLYGGWYYVDDEIFAVFTTRDSDRCRENVDTILEELGLPHI